MALGSVKSPVPTFPNDDYLHGSILWSCVAEFILAGWSFLPLVYAYRLTNQSPEHKLLLQLLGEAHKSKPLPLLQASFTIPLALPDKNQNKAARSGGEREA